MCVILAITNTTNSKINLIECESVEDALRKMKALYENLAATSRVDHKNSYFDSEIKYAQIVNNLEQIEMRIGILKGSV